MVYLGDNFSGHWPRIALNFSQDFFPGGLFNNNNIQTVGISCVKSLLSRSTYKNSIIAC